MNDDNPPQPPEQAQSPPLAPGSVPAGATPIPPSAPSDGGTKWPKVIGIIALVLGALELFGAPMQALSYFSVKMTMMDLPGIDSVKGEVDAYLSKFLVTLLVSGAIYFLLAAALIVAAIFLLKRRKKSVPLLKGWAVAKCIAAIVLTVFTISLVNEQTSLMTAAMGDLDEAGANMITISSKVGGIVGAVAGMLWGIILPVFLLVWFAREKIRAETREWS